MSALERFDVAVIGAGAVGASIALELTRRGASVVVLDRGEDWATGCSARNAGLICPSHAGHYASRRDLVHAIRWMLRSDSPFGIRPRPALVPFLARLLLSMRSSTLAATTELMRQLALRGLARHVELASEGLDTKFRQAGLLDVYETSAGLTRALRAATAHARAGLEPTPVTASELNELEPALVGRFAGGILYPWEAHCDPTCFAAAVGAAAQAAGAAFMPATSVLRVTRTQAAAAVESSGDRVIADTVVIAAGSWSPELVRRAGYRVPVEPGKGYSIDLEIDDEHGVRRPLMLQEARVAVTPVGGRVRLAGTMQFEGLDQRIDERRLAAIRAAAARSLPATSSASVLGSWSGLRPCTPDGLPLIGWIHRSPSIALATGHAMLGLTLAPVTGQLVADLLDGRHAPELDSLSPARFPAFRRSARWPRHLGHRS